MFRTCSDVVALLALSVVAFAFGCSSPSPPPPISVTLSPWSPQAIDQGDSLVINATVANDPLNEGVTWTLYGVGSLNATNGPTVTYTPPASYLNSAQQVTVTAISVADSTKRVSLQITVNPYLSIVPFQTLPSGSVGTTYTHAISFTGGTPPFKWSVYEGSILTGALVGGSVPEGLTLDPGTGEISGTPVGGGTWYFDATLSDATGASDGGTVSLEIYSNAPALNPIPLLNQPVVPTAVSPGSPGFTLSVSGTGFVAGATIDCNRRPFIRVPWTLHFQVGAFAGRAVKFQNGCSSLMC